MTILVNGQTREIDSGTSVAALIRDLGLLERRIAVELNRTVMPRTRWDSTVLVPDDRLEIVQFVGGG